MFVPGPDLLRLALVPAFVALAVLDIRTRRIPRWVWWPLGAIGMVALVWAGWTHYGIGGFAWNVWVVQVGLSVGLIAPLGYLFYRMGAFGGADAKALITIAIAFPTFPTIHIAGYALPVVESAIGVFSLTILVNGVFLGLTYPIALAVLNATRGHTRLAMFVGLPVHWSSLERRHGVLLEGPHGFTRYGLDLDALRMYLRWRDVDLATIRENPERFRDPATLPEEPMHPGDGRVRTDGGTVYDPDDPWGARTFLEMTGGAYGTRAEELRGALSLLAEREQVWVSPGIPFLVPLTGGLVLAFLVGDLFTLATGLLGL